MYNHVSQTYWSATFKHLQDTQQCWSLAWEGLGHSFICEMIGNAGHNDDHLSGMFYSRSLLCEMIGNAVLQRSGTELPFIYSLANKDRTQNLSLRLIFYRRKIQLRRFPDGDSFSVERWNWDNFEIVIFRGWKICETISRWWHLRRKIQLRKFRNGDSLASKDVTEAISRWWYFSAEGYNWDNFEMTIF